MSSTWNKVQHKISLLILKGRKAPVWAQLSFPYPHFFIIDYQRTPSPTIVFAQVKIHYYSKHFCEKMFASGGLIPDSVYFFEVATTFRVSKAGVLMTSTRQMIVP